MDTNNWDHADGEAETLWVGFVDLLGYKEIVLGSRSDKEKMQIIHSIYSALIQPIEDLNFDEGVGDTVGGDAVRRIHFSDCFYFTSKSAVSLADSMSSFFSFAFMLYENTYATDPSQWIPFLRGGIAGGWTLMFRDPTIPQDRETMFRNPVGPSVAKAYLVGEKQKVSGMRIMATKDFSERYEQELADMAATADSHVGFARHLCPVPIPEPVQPDYRQVLGDALWEIPWPRLLDNCGRWIENFAATRNRQFDAVSIKHWHATHALLRRCAQAGGENHLIQQLDAIH